MNLESKHSLKNLLSLFFSACEHPQQSATFKRCKKKNLEPLHYGGRPIANQPTLTQHVIEFPASRVVLAQTLTKVSSTMKSRQRMKASKLTECHLGL